MPRYTNPLTDTDIRNATPQSKLYKLFDGGGLFLLVTPAGGKWWRLKYRFDGKEKQISLGVYPAVSLEDARIRRDEARRLVASGINPSEARRGIKASSRFAAEIQFMRDKITEIARLAIINKLSLKVTVGVWTEEAAATAQDIQQIGTFVINCSGGE